MASSLLEYLFGPGPGERKRAMFAEESDAQRAQRNADIEVDKFKKLQSWEAEQAREAEQSERIKRHNVLHDMFMRDPKNANLSEDAKMEGANAFVAENLNKMTVAKPLSDSSGDWNTFLANRARAPGVAQTAVSEQNATRQENLAREAKGKNEVNKAHGAASSAFTSGQEGVAKQIAEDALAREVATAENRDLQLKVRAERKRLKALKMQAKNQIKRERMFNASDHERARNLERAKTEAEIAKYALGRDNPWLFYDPSLGRNPGIEAWMLGQRPQVPLIYKPPSAGRPGGSPGLGSSALNIGAPSNAVNTWSNAFSPGSNFSSGLNPDLMNIDSNAVGNAFPPGTNLNINDVDRLLRLRRE